MAAPPETPTSGAGSSGPSTPEASDRSDLPPGGLQAEGAVYRPHERSSRLRFTAPSGWISGIGIVAVSLGLPLLAFGWPPSGPTLPGLPTSLGGTYLAGVLLFLVPGLLGNLLTTPIAVALEGRFRVRRSLFLGLSCFGIVGGILVMWRIIQLFAGPYPVEGPLLLGFGLTLWLRALTLIAVSHHSLARSLPASLVAPLLGLGMVWLELGWGLRYLLEGPLFLLLAIGGALALLTATDRPMRREFGQGGIALLRPLLEHMSERHPGASRDLESFFDRVSTHADLELSVLAFRPATAAASDRALLAWIAPSVHPGPFADLGSSDLPRKMSAALRPAAAESVMVPHAPSTHAQDIPTAAEVQRVCGIIRDLVRQAPAGTTRASPLVRPHEGSLARAQVVGDSVLVVLSQAPRPTDDIDYALAELVREDARRLGLAHAIVVDAHNAFEENRGDVPFGSPEGFRMVADAKAAMTAALAQAKEGELRMGFAQRKGYNPEDDGMGGEGLSVVVLEGSGWRSAYALFDANNLLMGMRAPLVGVLEQAVGAVGEVMTTDNHVVHEVQGGANTLGERRGLPLLSRDLKEVAQQALAHAVPVRVAAAETKAKEVRVLGPGVITRLMTSLADSFAIFWLFFLASIALAGLAGALVLAFLR